MGRTLHNLQRFFQELKRRNVYKVGGAYLVASFVVLQLAGLAAGAFGLPSWFEPMTWVLCGLGLPLAVVVAWAFEVTPEGVRRTPEATPSARRGGEAEVAEEEGQPRTAYKLLIALGLTAAAVTGGWYLTGGSGQPEVTDRSIAVLPFESGEGGSAGDLAAGMDGSLASRLGSISELRVRPSRAVNAYRNTTLSLAEVAEDLGVSWIVSGEVHQAEDQIRVIVELVDPETRSQRWSEDYTRDLTPEGLFTLQSEITKEIAASLEAELTSQEAEAVARRPTQSLDAYRHYAKGRRLLDSRDEQDLIRAAKYFRRAIRTDSTYAQPWAGLADAAGLYKFYVSDSLPPAIPNQERAARRALDLNPKLAEAHASLGLMHAQNRAGPAALKELSRAVELKPSYAQAHNWLATMLVHLGRPGPGLAHATLAVELNPGNPALWDELYRARIANGDYEGALRATANEPPEADSVSAHWFAASALAHLEDWPGVRERVKRVLPDSLSMDTAPVYVLALADLGMGDTTSARARLRAMQERVWAGSVAPHLWSAVVQEALGQREAALTSVRQALEEARDSQPPTLLPHVLRYYYPDILASLRSDPRFAVLMREFNLMWGLNPDGSLPDSVDVAIATESDE